jgi:outer membrane protein TolC
VARQRVVRAGLVPALLAVVPCLWAEERPVTLAEAIALAEAGNPELRATAERAAAEGQHAAAARRLLWPRLALTSGWSRTDNPSFVFSHKLTAGEFTQEDFAIDTLNAPPPVSHLETRLGLEAPLDLFGKISAQADGRGGYARAAAAGTREAVQELRLRVTEAYRRAELARRAVEVTERALAGARAREADMQSRVEEGASLAADLLRVRARRRLREAERAERGGDLAVASAGLTRLLGAPAGTRFVPTEAPAPPAPLTGELSAWSERAFLQRPLLEGVRAREEAAGALRKGEGKALLPDLGVYASVQDDRNRFDSGGQSYLVGAFLRFAPFDPSRGKRQAAAEAEARAATQDVRAAADQLRLEVETAWRRAQTARERFAAAAGGAEEGREALRVVKERRQAGLATLTDELETEAQSLAAELEEIRAAAEVAVADAALRRAAGEI